MEQNPENVNSQKFYTFLLNLLRVRKRFALMMTGSFLELPIQYTIAYTTDLDVMFIPMDICALPPNMSTPSNFRGTSYTIVTNDKYPGFARLYAIDGKRLHKPEKKISYHDTRRPAYTHSIITAAEKVLIDICCHHESSRFKEIPIRLSELKRDKVIAVYCPCWPTVADEWKTRERPSGWPPKELIATVVTNGCYFVAKPHQSSPNDDTQWRFSFSKKSFG